MKFSGAISGVETKRDEVVDDNKEANEDEGSLRG